MEIYFVLLDLVTPLQKQTHSTIQYSTIKYNLTVIDYGTAPGNLFQFIVNCIVNCIELKYDML